MSRASGPRRLPRREAFPRVVLVVLLVATVAVAIYVARSTFARDELRFRNLVTDVQRDVGARLDTYIALLRAGAGLMAASDSVTVREFRSFASRLELRNRYPGVQGIGWSRRLDPADEGPALAFLRSIYGAEVRLYPDSVGTPRHAILYLEPLDRRNRAALGYDMTSEPTRRAAMQQARDEATVAMSGPVTLVQEIDPEKQVGFLIYVPVYSGGITPATVEARRDRLRGFIYSPFRAGDLFRRVLSPEVERALTLRIYDGADTSAAGLLYASDAGDSGRGRGVFEARERLNIAGREWTLMFVARPGFRRFGGGAPWILAGGGLLSLVLFALTRGQVRARRIAETSTADLLASREALRASEERYRTLLEQSPLSTQIFAPDGRTLLVNAAWERLWKTTLEELGDYNVLEDPVLAEARVTPLIRRAFAGEALALPAIPYPLERIGRPDRIWVRAYIYPVTDAEGRVREVVLVHEDISEQRAAEDRLREQLEVMDTITRNTAEALFLLDADGRATFMNPAAERTFGWSRHEMLGQVLHDLVHARRRDGSEHPAAECPLMQCLRSGEPLRHHEDVFFRRDGAALEVICSLSPIVRQGRVTSAVMVVSDVTERHRTELALRQAQKLESIGVLAGGIAHDFNNLLTGILGNVSLAIRTLPPDGEDRTLPLLRDVVRASERAAELTNQLLAYAGKGRFFVAPVRLDLLIRELEGLLRTSVPKKVELRFELAEALPAVVADASQLQQLVMNLTLNGAEAIGDDVGTVTLRARAVEVEQAELRRDFAGFDLVPGRYVRLEVVDTGSGMDDATLAQIFDPFFTTKFTGRGLGLAAALGIVRGHGGGIRVESAPGRGSRFTVLLPAAEVEVAPEEEPPAAPPRPRTARVLVVDDEPAVRQVARAMLESEGYSVLEAENGRRAVDLIAARPNAVDLVLLDMTMPVMGGDEALRLLRQIRPDLAVLASSGYGETEALDRFTGLAVAGFVQKPYTADRLAQAVAAALNGG